MQAGLGGGSSDAAAALLGLRRLWKLRVRDAQVHALAARLGSDVPFFLVGGTALGLGRGDEVYPLENLPRYWVVLAIPPFGVATADAYRWFDEAREQGSAAVSQSVPEQGRAPFAERAASSTTWKRPSRRGTRLLAELKQRLAERGALMAAMSGSGSTVFGVFTIGVGCHGRSSRQ